VNEVSKQIGKLNLLHDVYLKSLNTTKFVNSVYVCLHVAAAIIYSFRIGDMRMQNMKKVGKCWYMIWLESTMESILGHSSGSPPTLPRVGRGYPRVRHVPYHPPILGQGM